MLPGPTLTEGFRAVLEERGARGEEEIARAGRAFVAENRPTSLPGRPATPEEVANMVVHLSSEPASASTGAAVRVDGGVVRAIP